MAVATLAIEMHLWVLGIPLLAGFVLAEFAFVAEANTAAVAEQSHVVA